MLKDLIKEGKAFKIDMSKFIEEEYKTMITDAINGIIRDSSSTLLKNYSFSFSISEHKKFETILKKYNIPNDKINIVMNIKENYSRECNLEFFYNGTPIKQYNSKYPFIQDIIPELIRRAINQSSSNPNLDDLLKA